MLLEVWSHICRPCSVAEYAQESLLVAEDCKTVDPLSGVEHNRGSVKLLKICSLFQQYFISHSTVTSSNVHMATLRVRGSNPQMDCGIPLMVGGGFCVCIHFPAGKLVPHGSTSHRISNLQLLIWVNIIALTKSRTKEYEVLITNTCRGKRGTISSGFTSVLLLQWLQVTTVWNISTF